MQLPFFIESFAMMKHLDRSIRYSCNFQLIVYMNTEFLKSLIHSTIEITKKSNTDIYGI